MAASRARNGALISRVSPDAPSGAAWSCPAAAVDDRSERLGLAQLGELPDRGGLQSDLARSVCQGEFARHAHRATPRIGRDGAAVLPVVHPGDHDPLVLRHVVEGDAGVEVAAVVQPVCALGGRQGRLVGEGELVGQDVAPATGVVVDDLDSRGLAGQLADIPAGPVEGLAVRTGGGADDLVVDQQVDRGLHRDGIACSPENMMWSTRMWPQPPVLLSTIWICACLPSRSATFHATQFASSLS